MLVLTLTTPALAHAQESAVEPPLTAQLTDLAAAAAIVPASSSVVTPSDFAPRRDAVRRDGLFRSVSLGFAFAAGADLSISMYQINNGTARESGFGAQWQDTPVAFAASKAAVSAAFLYGLSRIHKTRPKTALVIGIAATAVEGWLAVRAARMTPNVP